MKPIEIIRPSCLTDKQQIKTFREFLPLEQVGAIPEVTFDDFFDRAMDEENADNLLSEPKYYLHSNWDFNTIVKDAKHRSGHDTGSAIRIFAILAGAAPLSPVLYFRCKWTNRKVTAKCLRKRSRLASAMYVQRGPRTRYEARPSNPRPR